MRDINNGYTLLCIAYIAPSFKKENQWDIDLIKTLLVIKNKIIFFVFAIDHLIKFEEN